MSQIAPVIQRHKVNPPDRPARSNMIVSSYLPAFPTLSIAGWQEAQTGLEIKTIRTFSNSGPS